MIQSKNRIFYKAAADFKENQYSMYQIYLLHNGYWIFTIGDEKCYINSNCIFCTDNRTKIEVLFHQGKEAECIAFSLENSDQYRSSELMIFHLRNRIHNGVLLLDEKTYRQAANWFASIHTHLPEKPDEIFKLIHLLNSFLKNMIPSDIYDSLACSVRKYLDTHYHENISIENLCKIFSTNRTTLAKHFQEGYGTTISKYIMEKRIRHAKNLLTFTSMPLAEVAFACGFEGQSYFSKSFSESVGIPPFKYRQTQRK